MRAAVAFAAVAFLAAAAAGADAAARRGPHFSMFGIDALQRNELGGGQNGGADCAACTLLIGLVSQNGQIHNVTAKESFKMVCGYFPKLLKDACDIAVGVIGWEVEGMIDRGETADVICNAVKMCKRETATCHLFPKPPALRAPGAYERHVDAIVDKYAHLRSFNICSILPQVCRMEDHLPAFDTDGDKFSTYEALRGTYWRGKDCNDLDSSVFPGAATADPTTDGNCNGIYGTDATTGKTWEQTYCDGTGAMGVASLGDSATAHFRIPPDYMTASKLSKATFAHLLRNAENELDWPMLSWSTGHLNANSFAPDVTGPMSSFYSNLAANNLCNHRDYQNLGVNGAKVENLVPFAKELARNASGPVPVKPLFLIMSMIGNDVCNHRHDFSSMTTPQEYRRYVMEGLRQADATVPAGTKVLLIPLVDGRILYDTMHARTHPIGETNKDVTYTALYDFLNCLDVSPCWGWMNSNATVRNHTWEIASALGAELPKIVADTKGQWQNIEPVYLGNVFDEALQSYQGQRWQLIEPVDGFHPSQLANSLLGQYLWNQTRDAGLTPAPNPNNAAIKARFGDQGGY